MDVSEKVAALKLWLSENMGGEVDRPRREFRPEIYGFRIRVPDIQPPPMLWVSLEGSGLTGSGAHTPVGPTRRLQLS